GYCKHGNKASSHAHGSNPPYHLDAVNMRHPDIRHNQLRVSRGNNTQSCLAVVGHYDPKAVSLQDNRNEIECFGVVLYDQDLEVHRKKFLQPSEPDFPTTLPQADRVSEPTPPGLTSQVGGARRLDCVGRGRLTPLIDSLLS